MSENASSDPNLLTDYSFLFCLSFQLKGVCNSKFGDYHNHHRLSKKENGMLMDWKAHYCATLPPPPVSKVRTTPCSDIGSMEETTIINQIKFSRVGNGRQRIWESTPCQMHRQPAIGTVVIEIKEYDIHPTGVN